MIADVYLRSNEVKELPSAAQNDTVVAIVDAMQSLAEPIAEFLDALDDVIPGRSRGRHSICRSKPTRHGEHFDHDYWDGCNLDGKFDVFTQGLLDLAVLLRDVANHLELDGGNDVPKAVWKLTLEGQRDAEVKKATS